MAAAASGPGHRNIILCGFMGCGKTTLGPLIAQRTGRPFLDSDLRTEEKAGMRIPEIFRTHGENGFRDLEHQVILELAAGRDTVVSTGGGVLVYPRNVAPLRETGVLLYLNPGFDECYRRIEGTDRPLVVRHTREELAHLYRIRHKLYRAAAHLELTLQGPPEHWLEAAMQLLRPC